MKNRKQIEQEFHDKLRMVSGDIHVADTRWSPEMEDTIKKNAMWVNMKYYSIERQSRNMVLNWFKENCKGKRVLDYCCGNGADSIIIAQNGASEVIGIDLSDVSIRNCLDSAKKNHLDNVISFMVRDAENTGFEDNSFDIITEYGALHHLDLKKAFPELSRVLRPGGKIICNEALGHNPAIHLYRKLTPRLRTEWEVAHIMRKNDFELAQRYFGRIEMHFFHFFALMAVPFRKSPFFEHLLHGFENLHSAILKLPKIRWWAWQVVFILSEPKRM